MNSILTGRRNWRACAALLLVLVAPNVAAAAQDSGKQSYAATTTKLNAIVHLSLGTTTVANVVAELARQTGLVVSATPAVANRNVTAELAGVSARQALDALAELNGWSWYETTSGACILSRRPLQRPKDRSEIPALMQAVLPPDIRTFLGLPDLRKKHAGDRTSEASLGKVGSATFGALGRLQKSLTATFLERDVLPVSALSPAQRSDLVTWLFFTRIRNSLELLHDDPAPHHMVLDKIVLSIQQGSLDVDTAAGVVPGFGFGAQILTADGKAP